MEPFSLPDLEVEDLKLFNAAAVSEMVKHGMISQWYCKPKQATVVDFLRITPDPFEEASRRFGKTTTVLAYDIEESIKNPIVTRWCEPWKNQCREIVMTEMDKIQSKIPARYRFHWKTTDSYYECEYNGSRIYLRGVNEDKGESARGTAAHIIVCDELGSWRYPIYVIGEVLSPQLITTGGKFVFLGTPPNNLTHAYYDMKEAAKMTGRFIQRTVKDQELVPWAEIEKAVVRMSPTEGWNSAAVRRELLCEKVVDKNFAIVPEWKAEYAQPVVPDEFFQFYFKYDALDIGVRDLTVCLLAYYDFQKAKLFIMDEVVMNGPEMTTEKLANEIKVAEALRFANPAKKGETYKLRKRVSDIDLLLLNDLSKLHALYFEPTDKGKLEEMVNEVRIWVNAGRVIVDPRCEQTIDCLSYGIWDEHRKQWERSDRLGHFDALAALMYLIRNVDSRTNPIPPEYGKPSEAYFFDEAKKQANKEKLKKLFGVRVPGRRLI